MTLSGIQFYRKRKIHKLRYKHGAKARKASDNFLRPSSPRDKSIRWQKTTDRSRKNLLCGSILKGCAKSLGRFRSDREKTRKAEISKDFSAFFAPNFFQISIDPFSIFLRVEGFELFHLKSFRLYYIIKSERWCFCDNRRQLKLMIRRKEQWKELVCF